VKVHHGFDRAWDGQRPLVLSIGFFDGLHRGHREILRALMRLRRPGFRAAAFTFSNHPATFLRPDRVPPLIATLEERINLLAASGIDELFVVPFDERIARVEARRFLSEFLVERLRIGALVVGENFRFGADRQGDVRLARDVLAQLGVGVMTVAPLLDEGERISSTRVRSAIAAGDLPNADRLLGHSYEVRGAVVLGDGRGHDLGFPTANLRVAPEKLLPKDGVYRAVARHDGRDYVGLVSIGTNPTFDGRERRVEAWLLDFKRTVYGEDMVLRDFSFIREQRTFDGVDELVAQMRDDATHVHFPSFIPT